MTTPNPASIFGKHRSMEATTAVPPEDKELTPVVTEAPLDDEAARARTLDFSLGNHELPIAAFREQIIDAVDASQATIITAETGAGKSTQVPQFLAERGYEVIVTQPRVVAARSVAERVREEVVEKHGADFTDFVGYRTARERGDSPENQILFATDGLQLVRELNGHGVGKKQALVLDEVHEWNENMEVLVAWAKQRMNEDPDFKVVVMSATMEAGPLAKYFAEDRREVPVIEVPGRTFDVKKSEGGDVADEAIKKAREGKNTLVFVPGKAEIGQVIAEIERAKIPDAIVLPLHGQLEAAEQRKVFAKYPGVKIIVATNVAQTSVTIEDIDAVVDSGLERRNEVKNGVEGLYMRPISRADCMQRAGRAGRTKEGEYVLAQLGNNPFVGMNERESYGTPEILRTRLDGMVLRLAKNGFDAAEMDFYHSQDEQGRDIKPEIAAAKERLQKLGALREDDSITKIGRDMERMPLESHYARMMIEARKYGPEVQMQLAAMLAVQEADGIVQFDSRNKPSDERWRSLLQPGANDSDVIKQLEVFIAARKMSDKQRRENDIFVKAYSKANEVLRQLRGVEKLQDHELATPTTEQRERLVKCIISGMVDNLYIDDYGHRNAKGDMREISSRSIIRPGKMVVGKPFDLQINTRRGMTTLHLLESPTNVPSIDTLREVAPQLFSERSAGYMVDENGVVIERFTQLFNGQNTGEEMSRAAAESAERTEYIVRRTAEKIWYSDDTVQIMRAVADINNRQPNTVNVITFEGLQQALAQVLPGTVGDLREAYEFAPQFTLDDLVPTDMRAAVYAASPDEINGLAVTYKDGVPIIGRMMTEDEILAMNADEFATPDGRRMMVPGARWGSTLGVAERQKEIMEARAERAEREEREQKQRVEYALSYLEMGFTPEQTARQYSQEAVSEAQVLFAARREEETRRQQESTERVLVLLEENETLYDTSRVNGLDDAPEALQDKIYGVRDALDTLKYELERAKQRAYGGATIEVEAYRVRMDQLQGELQRYLQELRSWQTEQDARSTVSPDALEALRNKFSGRH